MNNLAFQVMTRLDILIVTIKNTSNDFCNNQLKVTIVIRASLCNIADELLSEHGAMTFTIMTSTMVTSSITTFSMPIKRWYTQYKDTGYTV